jgi:ATP-dependent Clp protease ATP-binding subunit ClpA
VFERFTEGARRMLVLAQLEADLLNHSHIGTEHLLLGLIHDDNGVAAKALEQLGMTLDAVRDKVEQIVGTAGTPPVGSRPFTSRATTVLELSLREALQLGHNHIGTEHLLLGLVREGEGIAAQVLVSLGAGLEETRETVLTLLAPRPTEEEEVPPPFTSPLGRQFPILVRPRARAAVGFRKTDAPIACSFCGRQPPDTGQLFAGDDASICEHCVRQWSEQLREGEGGEDD